MGATFQHGLTVRRRGRGRRGRRAGARGCAELKLAAAVVGHSNLETAEWRKAAGIGDGLQVADWRNIKGCLR